MGKNRHSQNYQTFLDSHPRLKNRHKLGINDYHPVKRIGERLSELLPGILKTMGGERSRKLEDYLPLYHDPFAKVKKSVNDNLRELICDKINKINKKVSLTWPGESHHQNKDLQLFWYCYARSLNPSANKMKSWAGIKLLDVLSLFLDYNSFYDFINKEYPPHSNAIYVLHIPFSVKEENRFVEEIVYELIGGLANGIGEEIQVLTFDASVNRDRKRQAEEFLETHGLPSSESLLVMGEVFGSSQFRLECHVYNEVWSDPNGSWSEFFDMEELKDPKSTAYKKISLSIFWCLFNRNFFHQNYEASYDYLLRAFDLGLDMYEVPFRVGVLTDLMEKPLIARLHYLSLLEFLGVDDAIRQLSEMSNKAVDPNAVDTGTGIYIENDYVHLEDIKLDCPHFHPKMKIMYFEIVRMKLFSKLKDKLDPLTFERVLRKILKHTKGEWLSNKHRDLFGEANYEMGKWLITNKNPEMPRDIRKLVGYYEKAVTYSSNESIHRDCLPILANSGRLGEITAMVKRTHAQHPTILALYGIDPSPDLPKLG